jgi:HEAT repeat protein
MIRQGRRAADALAGMLLLGLLAAASASAQPAPAADPRARYQREQDTSKDRPRTQQQFDESLRKFEADDLPTRLEGVAAMGQIDKKDEPRAVTYLLSAANDPNVSVRSKAIDTLGHMRAKEATTALVQRLFMRDTDDFTRRRILASLGRIGDKRAIRPLLDFASGKANVDTRAGAVYAIGEIGDPDAIPALERIAAEGDDPALRDVAKVAVRRIKAQPRPTEVPPSLAGDRRGPGPGEEE